jgi:hypothetical protein
VAVVSAVETLAKSFQYLRELLADSELWQAMQLMPEATYEEIAAVVTDGSRIDTATRTAGMAKILGDVIPEDMGECDPSTDIPRIIIRYMPDLQIARSSTSGRETTAQFMVLVETVVPVAYRGRTAEQLLNQTLDHLNKIGGLIREWNAVVTADTPGRLLVNSWDLSQMGLVAPEESSQIGDGWMRTAHLTASFMGLCP